MSKPQTLSAVLIVALLTSRIYGLECQCEQNATCLENTHYCVCPQNYIGVHCQVYAPNITEQPVQAQITQNFSYFYFEPQGSNYFQVKLQICIEKALAGSQNLLFVDIEGRDGNFSRIAPPNRDATFQSRKQCFVFYTPFLPFQNKFNQKTEKLIFGMRNDKGTAESPETIIIKCQGSGLLSQAFWLTLIISFLSVVGVLIIGSIIFCIKQRYFMRNRQTAHDAEHDLEHFNKVMPSVRYSTLNEEIAESSVGGKERLECSICLSEIESQELIRKTPCSHIFHQQCLDQWCIKQISCPVCRSSFQRQALQQLQMSLKENTNIRQPMLPTQ